MYAEHEERDVSMYKTVKLGRYTRRRPRIPQSLQALGPPWHFMAHPIHVKTTSFVSSRQGNLEMNERARISEYVVRDDADTTAEAGQLSHQKILVRKPDINNCLTFGPERRTEIELDLTE